MPRPREALPVTEARAEFVAALDAERKGGRMRKKITVVGAGNVGAAAAQCCLAQGLGDVVLLDAVENVARGKALDLSHAAVLEGHSGAVSGTADYADSAGSDVVIITAGLARKPGMSRDELLESNCGIMTQVIRDAVNMSPEAFYIIVSNPVDVMCLVAMKMGKLPARRVVGLSGTLDEARMCANIARLANVPGDIVRGMVIGEHGDNMVPLPRLAAIGGLPATSVLGAEQLEEVCAKTVRSGAEVVSLLGYSAYYGPGKAVAIMAEKYLRGKRSMLCCSCWLSGQYGAEGIFMGVPALLGEGGISNIVEIALEPGEREAIAKSIAAISANTAKAEQFMAGR